MKHKITTREKDGSIQAIVSYKYDDSIKWKSKSKQGFAKKSDAQRWASATVVELAEMEGRHLADENMTIGDAAELFLSTKQNLSTNSKLSYASALKQISAFNDVKLKKLNAIKTQEISQCVSPGMIHFIKIFWRYLLKMDLIKKSYLDLKKTPPKKRNTIINPIDYKKFIKSEIPHELRVFCIVAYSTGMRAGEILGLTPECVKKNRIIVDRQWNKIDSNIYGFTTLKNKDKGIREIPISIEVYNALNSLPFNFKEGRFFTYNRAERADYYMQKAGFPHTAHHFRHTRASEMVHSGFNLKYVAYILGDTLETVIQTYVALSEDMRKEENKKFLSTFCREAT